MALASTGYDFDNFAKDAKVIVVDIDEDEHRKRTRKIDIFLQYDICDFLLKIDVENRITRDELDARLNWYKQYKEYCYLNDVASKSKWKDGINMYAFLDALMEQAPDGCVFVSDTGSSVFAVSQAIRLKGNQSYVTSGAQVEMGFTIPACVGASQANRGIICGITGDGSFQLNIQELQTIKHYNLPIKLFVLNNGGYLSIKTPQDKYFNRDYIGVNKKSGVSFPSLRKIAKAYGIKYKLIKNAKGSNRIIKNIFNDIKPCICEVFCGGDQEIAPIVSPSIAPDGSMIPGSFDKMYPELEV
jgi:acetolactate synthase-1/2/3 large subunit